MVESKGCFFFQAEDGIRDSSVTGVQTCALPISEIGEVRRQREDWQRDATRDLATGRTGAAIHAYDRHGMVHVAESREQARGELIDRWDRERKANQIGRASCREGVWIGGGAR